MKQQMCARCGERPAVIYIQKMEGDEVKPEGLCIQCARELNIGSINQMIDKLGISDEELEQASEQMSQFMENMGDFNFGDMSGMFNSENMDGAQTMPFANLFGDAGELAVDENESGQKQGKKRGKKGNKRQKDDGKKYLNTYCTNLTGKARDGKLDAIIGREQEISRTVQILCRRTKNNPCLIGEPGVGKTAIAEGLAIRIAKGQVPARLADKEIYLLDLTALVAGTQFRGQFEGRIKGLVDEVKAQGNIILFIDEVHNLVGTGDSEGTMNAANILKPALSRGEIQVIGATTFTEYRKFIEKDAALERRFQPVKIEEPSVEDAYKMLLGIKGYYEQYHKVQISDTLVYKAVLMSERYVTDRYLPDKAIDLLDESCTCANLRNPAISQAQILEDKKRNLQENIENLSEPTEEDQQIDYELISKLKTEVMAIDEKLPALQEKAKDNQVLESDIASAISMWTGIPAAKIEQGDIQKLAGLEPALKAHIIGQDEAIEKVAAAVRRGRVQISPRKRPQSFIFVGPTGVGKTELVKQLAAYMFDTPDALIRLDMSEYMEKFSVSRIIGSPPGYVGYDDAGQLTEKVRRKPYSVILFDEIEKAHKDVLNILLQILDEGRITDAQGRTVNFENTIIIMTTNAGSEFKSAAAGFNSNDEVKLDDNVDKSLKQFFKPEFLNRIDDIIVFDRLTEDNIKEIAKLMLKSLEKRLNANEINVTFTESAVSKIAKSGFDPVYGARPLRRAIQNEIEDMLSEEIIDGNIKSGDSITVDVEDDKFTVKK